MRIPALFAVCVLLAACAPNRPAPPGKTAPESDRLPAGTWGGGLTPMNHPDMVMPLTYVVGYDGGAPTLRLGAADAMVAARDVAVRGDTLFFAFNEPEENVLLRCALGPDGPDGFAGRCTDAAGKWARFTMTPPVE